MRWGKKLVGLIAVNSVISIFSQNITHSNAEEAPYIQHKLQICRATVLASSMKNHVQHSTQEVSANLGACGKTLWRKGKAPPFGECVQTSTLHNGKERGYSFH